jgi:DNA-binding MarR family transcriptional regulator
VPAGGEKRSEQKRTEKQSDTPLLWLIWETFQYSRRAFDEALRPYGVSGTQLSVLNRVAERPGISGAELARLMLTTPQAALLSLTALERKGLIQRRLDTGAGHVTRSAVTDEGRRLVESCRAEVHTVGRRLLSVLSADKQRTLRDLLTSYLQGLPDAVDD